MWCTLVLWQQNSHMDFSNRMEIYGIVSLKNHFAFLINEFAGRMLSSRAQNYLRPCFIGHSEGISSRVFDVVKIEADDSIWHNIAKRWYYNHNQMYDFTAFLNEPQDAMNFLQHLRIISFGIFYFLRKKYIIQILRSMLYNYIWMFFENLLPLSPNRWMVASSMSMSS